jgi:hypothetical protein
MVFPLMKVVIVLVKTTSKPTATFLKGLLKDRKMMSNFFVWCGQKANMFEINITNRSLNSNEQDHKLKAAAIPDDEAFVKGVEYFVELLVLYGLIGFISVYEVKKSITASKELKKKLKHLETKNSEQENHVNELRF